MCSHFILVIVYNICYTTDEWEENMLGNENFEDNLVSDMLYKMDEKIEKIDGKVRKQCILISYRISHHLLSLLFYLTIHNRYDRCHSSKQS